MRIDVLTLFPEMVETVVRYGVTGRAVERGLLMVQSWNPRDYAADRHRTVDDRPYGGGPGMVMKVAPLRAALEAARTASPQAKVVYLSPQGRRFDQAVAREWSCRPAVILVAGRYEGIDERFINSHVDEEWSIGDYVLSGGELAAMVVIDACARLIPGVLGDAESALADSFMDGLLDYPHYTRPEDIDGQRVPDILCSGDHEQIRRWRLKQALGRTWMRRPELLAQRRLNEEQQTLLQDFIAEQKAGNENPDASD